MKEIAEDFEEEYELSPETEIRIDPDQLDVEWFRQADLYRKYGKAAAVAESEVKEAHERVKVVRSELIRDANRDPEACLGQGVKPSDPKVEAYYRNHKRHKDAKQELIEAEYVRDIMNIGKSAIYMRKTSLENLVRLATMGWFSTPVTPRTLKDLKDKIESIEDDTVERKIRQRADEKKEKPGGMQRGAKK